MRRIKLYDHPFLNSEYQEFHAPIIGEWLRDYIEKNPNINIQVFKGDPSLETEITKNIKALLANDVDEYVVLQSPGDPSTIFYVVMLVVAVAAIALAPKPQMPSNVNRTQQSPNNSLGNRENKVRLLERIEDIYGTVKSIPSLMMPTYLKYKDHIKYEYGYYCVSRGYCNLDELRDGDTLISDIDGASVAVYEPFTSPNSGSPVLQIGEPIVDGIVTATRSNEVDGITLKAPNQVQLTPHMVYTYTPNGGGDIITQAEKKPNFNSVLKPGNTIVITMINQVVTTLSVNSVTVIGSTKTYTDDDGLGALFANTKVGDSIVIAGFPSAVNNGAFTVATKPDANTITVSSGSQVDESANPVSISETLNYSGTRTVTAVNDGSIVLSGNTFNQEITVTALLESDLSTITINDVNNWTDWFTLRITDRNELWCNILAQNGMFKDSGGKSNATVTFEIEIEKLDADLSPTGIIETVSSSISGSVSDERAETVEHLTDWVGPARVRMHRTSDYDYDFEGTVVDEIKWADLYSVSPVNKNHFDNKTTIHTITRATSRATAVKSRQLNCIASRKLPIYNGTSFSGVLDAEGLLISGTISASSKLVDIIAAVSLDPKIGNQTLSESIDINQMYAVQQLLDAWNTECGQFNYTFDSDNLSFEETIVMIANAGFCIAYRQNGKIRLALDRAQQNSVALFTHRNKKPHAETITRKFANDAEYDGVEFVYVDPDTNQSETIKLPLDSSYTKLKKFEIAGIRSYSQAWLRANREYEKLIGQRITIETETTLEARSLLPNARIDIVDNTVFKSFDGEVVGQSGLTLTLSRDVEFSGSSNHSIVLIKRDGSLQSIRCTPGIQPNQIILASLPSEAIVTSYGIDGIRTIFSFASDDSRESMAYLVQEIDLSDKQYAKIRAINYSSEYYKNDYLSIPNKNAVIN
ncbi:MAG: host specificity factor TipJ family phage tail protein [Pseudomonadota bacterium]